MWLLPGGPCVGRARLRPCSGRHVPCGGGRFGSASSVLTAPECILYTGFDARVLPAPSGRYAAGAQVSSRECVGRAGCTGHPTHSHPDEELVRMAVVAAIFGCTGTALITISGAGEAGLTPPGCTSPRLPGRGSSWSRCGSASSNVRPSAAVASARCTTSTPRPAPSSTSGTTAATPLSGPEPPARTSPKPTVRPLQTTDH